MVHAKITLSNSYDVMAVMDNVKKESEIRKMDVIASVDSGAYMLAVNEEIVKQLGLRVIDKRIAELANGSLAHVDIVGPIEIRFENRMSNCNAMVLPGSTEVLLGAIPMEEMDVLIHPKDQKLIVNPAHPVIAQLSLK